MRRADLADLTAFVAVADTLSFRAAASRLGVTPSALSHTLRHFEERLGFRLLNRTTRSVSLTDAGLRLLDRLRPAVEQISRGLDDLKGEQGHPFGCLRLYVTHLAGAAVLHLDHVALDRSLVGHVDGQHQAVGQNFLRRFVCSYLQRLLRAFPRRSDTARFYSFGTLGTAAANRSVR